MFKKMLLLIALVSCLVACPGPQTINPPPSPPSPPAPPPPAPPTGALSVVLTATPTTLEYSNIGSALTVNAKNFPAPTIVEIFENGKRVVFNNGSFNSGLYVHPLTNLYSSFSNNPHVFTATVTDQDGRKATSAPLTVNVQMSNLFSGVWTPVAPSLFVPFRYAQFVPFSAPVPFERWGDFSEGGVQPATILATAEIPYDGQDVGDINGLTDEYLYLSGWFGNYAGDFDIATITVECIDGLGREIGAQPTIGRLPSYIVPILGKPHVYKDWVNLPIMAGTRRIRLSLSLEYREGTDNNAAVGNVYLEVDKRK